MGRGPLEEKVTVLEVLGTWILVCVAWNVGSYLWHRLNTPDG